MTTVAYDRRTGTMAADRLSGYHSRKAHKLQQLKDGSWVATAGLAALGRAIVAYLDGAGPRPEVKTANTDTTSVEYLRVYPDGRCTHDQDLNGEIEVLEPFFAIGSGADYAMGALTMGADAGQAVDVACQYDANSGNGVDIVHIGDGVLGLNPADCGLKASIPPQVASLPRLIPA